MFDNTIFLRKYNNEEQKLPVNEKEIWRYSGYMGLSDNVDEELKGVLSQVEEELKNSFAYKVCYRRIPIEWVDGMPVLPFSCESKNLATCLKGSSEIVIFAATIGLDIDRHIAKYQRFSPTKALLMQAYGAERVEALCDAFCQDIEAEVGLEGLTCTNRFSPGYGDLPLEKQIDVFRLLDCNRQIGISLNESLLMTPSKSVTAIFGLKKCDAGSTTTMDNLTSGAEHKCEKCSNIHCEYRRTAES